MASNKPRSSGRKAKPAAVNPDGEAKTTAAEQQAVKPGVPLALVHETPMPDADEFADEEGLDGTDNTTAARASALRAILINGEDARRSNGASNVSGHTSRTRPPQSLSPHSARLRSGRRERPAPSAGCKRSSHRLTRLMIALR